MHEKLDDEYLDFPDSPTLVGEKSDDFSDTFARERESSNFEIARICTPPGCYTCLGNTELDAHVTAVKVDFESINACAVCFL